LKSIFCRPFEGKYPASAWHLPEDFLVATTLCPASCFLNGYTRSNEAVQVRQWVAAQL
jgi:hypothetical protein